MSRDAALVCIIYLGLKLDIEDDKEEIDMCKEFRDYTRKCKKEGKRLGFKKGERLGIEKGERNAIRRMVSNLIKKSYTVLEICNLMDVSEEDVNEAILSLGQ